MTIAIVGAGPVGLVLALLLHRAGHDAQVLEADEDISGQLRASMLHPPTLDMLARLGLAVPLIEQGLVTRQWQIRRLEDGARAVFDLSAIADDTDHPFRLQVEQHKLSRLILAALPFGTVNFGRRVATVTQDGDGVTLTGPRMDPLRADWVVGCDGAHSVVCKAAGQDVRGSARAETTILASTSFAFHKVLPGLSNVNCIWTEHPAFAGIFLLLRVPGRWRVSLDPVAGESIEDALHPETIERKLQVIHPKPDRYNVSDLRPYRLRQRIVDDYRCGRLLLAGDAAHLNAPVGGMGMNSGIHDAFELAAHLVPVLRDEADATHLDRYTRRRRTVAEHEIIAHAARARMRAPDPHRRAARLAALQATAADPTRAREFLLASSMIAGLRAAAAIA